MGMETVLFYTFWGTAALRDPKKTAKGPNLIEKMFGLMLPKSAVGDVVEVLTTDPGSLSDFPAWAKTTGQQVVETKQEAGVIRIYVKRQK